MKKVSRQVVRLLVAMLGGLGGTCWSEHAAAGPIVFYHQAVKKFTVDADPTLREARPTSRPGTDVTEEVAFPDEVNCIETEGCFASTGFVWVPDEFSDDFVLGGNMPGKFSFRFNFPDAAVVDRIRGSPGAGRLTVLAARDLEKPGDPNPEDERLTIKAEGLTLGLLFGKFLGTKPCPGPPHAVVEVHPGARPDFPEVVVIDPDCGPNYHTDVGARDALIIPHETMNQLLDAGDTFLVIDIEPGSQTGRLKIFEVTLTYETPVPGTLLLLCAGLMGLLSSVSRRGTR